MPSCHSWRLGTVWKFGIPHNRKLHNDRKLTEAIYGTVQLRGHCESRVRSTVLQKNLNTRRKCVNGILHKQNYIIQQQLQTHNSRYNL